MRAEEVERALAETERALASGGRVDLRATGFWRAVAAVKRDPALIERHADRIAALDREAFLRATPLAFPAPIGAALLVSGTAAGVALVASAGQLPAPWRDLALLAGVGAVIGSTHGLAHLATGAAAGIRFTHVFSRPPLSPQPGFKTDYATYLRAPARARAWMHASGAIVSKAVPFAALPAAVAAGAAPATLGVLVAIGVGQLVTDALFSVRASDWKKFRREMRIARAR